MSEKIIDRGRSITTHVFLVLLGMMSLNAGAASIDEDLQAFKQAIRVKYDMKESAFAANDPNPIVEEFYSPNVISTGPDGVTHIGRDQLRLVYNEIISAEVEIESVYTFVNGDAGWDWANFHVTPPAESGESPFTFKILFLWNRVAGEWWSHGEMYVMGEFPEIGH